MDPRQDIHVRCEGEPDRWVHSACLLCSNGCGLDIAVKDGRIVGVRGDVEHPVNVGHLGPKGLNAAQTAFWEDAFAKLTRTPEWRIDVETGGSVNHYMNSRELAAYFDAQYAEFKMILGDLGLAK